VSAWVGVQMCLVDYVTSECIVRVYYCQATNFYGYYMDKFE